MKTLQKILGHTKYHTTADTYSHVTDKMKKEAVDSISRALKRADGDKWMRIKKEPIPPTGPDP